MSDRDFEIGSRKFKLNKLDPFKQFHILRRISPILSEIIPVIGKLGKNASEEQQLQTLVPIIHGLSKLSDDDANRVLLGLLSSVEIQQAPGNWARLATESSLMFQDLELPTLMQIAGRAFGYNLRGFLDVSPQVSRAKG